MCQRAEAGRQEKQKQAAASTAALALYVTSIVALQYHFCVMRANPPNRAARIAALLIALGMFGMLLGRTYRRLSSEPGGSTRKEPAAKGPDQIVIVQWNVENLFDYEDDPDNAGDNEFTPDTWRQWTQERYGIKLDHVARVLAELDGDVVCLQEVENRRVLDDLTEVLRRKYRCEYPQTLHREGPDNRGVDVAMLTRLDVEKVRWLTPLPDRREILAATLEFRGVPLTVFANHWKSRWGGQEESEPLRLKTARDLRSEIDRLLTADPLLPIVVAGDFNDDAGDPSMTKHALIVPNRAAVLNDKSGRLMYNLHGELPLNEWGTFFYRRGHTWNSFDAICVTRTLLSRQTDGASGWRVVPGTYAVFTPSYMLTPEGQPLAFRRVYAKETKRRPYQHGYSDHFPVRVMLELERTDLP